MKRYEEHVNAVDGGNSSHQTREAGVWWKSDESWVKINIDASIVGGTGMGFGAIFQNHQGHYITCLIKLVPEEIEVDIDEALACKEGLLLAKSLGLKKNVLETDSATVCGKLKTNRVNFSYLGHIVEDIKLISLSFDSFIPSFIGRSGNLVAHHLARHDFSFESYTSEKGLFPDHVLNLLDLEASS